METTIVTYSLDMFDDLELTVTVTSTASKNFTNFHMDWEIRSAYVTVRKYLKYRE